MTTRADIVAEARRWLGTPFKHQARVCGEGVDCGGIVVMIARVFDFDGGYRDPVAYPAQPHTDFMERLLDRYADPVSPVANRQPGDIVTFAFSDNLHHVALLVERDRILHAWNRGNNPKVVETGLTGIFYDAMRRVYKFRGVE